VILGQASARFLNRRYELDYETHKTVLVATPDRRGVVRWDNFITSTLDQQSLEQSPEPQARFATLEAPLSDSRSLTALQKDFLDWAYRTFAITVRANEDLRVFASPDVSPADFRTQCADAARQFRDEEIEKTRDAFERKMDTLKLKLQARNVSWMRTRMSSASARWKKWGRMPKIFSAFSPNAAARLPPRSPSAV
jgi:hypothetical protein